jgi:hypothetical protein
MMMEYDNMVDAAFLSFLSVFLIHCIAAMNECIRHTTYSLQQYEW